MSQGRVLAVAHKGGNSLRALDSAASAGADIVELDVQGDGLEVRHARDLKPLPLLFDRGRLRRGWGTRLVLDAVLDAAEERLDPGTRLMLDLKGTSTELGGKVAAALGARAQERSREYLVCGRHWPALELFGDLPHVQVLRSAGNPRELGLLREWVAAGAHVGGRVAAGVSLRHSLLTRALADELRERLPLLLVWTVNRQADLDRVLAAGAAGVITDRADFLRTLAGSPA